MGVDMDNRAEIGWRLVSSCCSPTDKLPLDMKGKRSLILYRVGRMRNVPKSRFTIRGRQRRSDGDDKFPLGVSFAQIAERFRHLF